MSFTRRLHTALGVAFMLVTANAIRVTAQTQTLADNSRASARAASSSNLKEIPGEKSSAAPAEKRAPDDTSEAKRDGSETSLEKAVPQGTQPPFDDEWQFQATPYFWLASLHGTAGVINRTTQVDESFSDIFHSLNFFIMGTFEARKGRFVSLTDIEYVSISDNKATPGPLFSNVDAKFKTFIFDPEAGYRVFDNPEKGAFVDVLGGVRVWHVSTEFDFGAGILPAVTVQGSRTWVDGVAGVRAKAALSEKLFVTGKFDLGGGGSKFTYQLFAGGGYNLNQNVALIFGYRALDVNYDKNNFIYDMNQRGPIMGVGFRF